ncbi:putative bli-3 protein [Geranomyces variabilis]|nr:putative bli-3 protein [Geranomyces variabilis]
MSSTADASTKARNLDETSSNEQQIAELYKLIDGIETAMLTTRNSNGQLVSRAMQTRQRVAGADIWFVTNIKSHKLDDLHFDPNVNVAYYKPSTSDWVSVSGTATISQDKAKIAELYQPDLKAWFGDLGDGIHNGEVNDPRIALVFVKAESVHYQMQNKSTPRVLFEIVRGSLTGERPAVGPLRELGASELSTARASGQK